MTMHMQRKININITTMASENIRSIEDMRKKNDKDMTENSDLERKIKLFF